MSWLLAASAHRFRFPPSGGDREPQAVVLVPRTVPLRFPSQFPTRNHGTQIDSRHLRCCECRNAEEEHSRATTALHAARTRSRTSRGLWALL
jgi:hypothetical protein